MIKTYIYSGPVSGVTLGEQEIMLHPGCTVDLPDDSEYTVILLLRGHLTEAAAQVGQQDPQLQPDETDPAADNTKRRK